MLINTRPFKAPPTLFWIFLKTNNLVLRFLKNQSRSPVAYSNRFRLSTRKRSISNVKRQHPSQSMHNVSSIQSMTSSNSKTFILVCPHVDEKPAFFKRCVFGDRSVIGYVQNRGYLIQHISYVQTDATTPNNIASVCTGLKVCPVSNFAQQQATTGNRVCKRTQHVTSYNVGSCCTTTLRRLHLAAESLIYATISNEIESWDSDGNN